MIEDLDVITRTLYRILSIVATSGALFFDAG